MDDEKVSVIVPVYNVEKYLRRCLDSIINQTYQNLEIILVDDGSPDNCGAICDEYAAKDDRIYVIHQENGGVSSARNAAICIATGEYIVFVDSDDSILPDYVTNLMSVGKADYAVSGCYVQSENGEWTAWENTLQHTTLEYVKANPDSIDNIPVGMVIAHRYKRSIIIAHALSFRSDISRSEDTLFNCIYLSFCDTVEVINTLDYRYHFNGASATSRLNTNLFRWSMESVMTIGRIIGTDNQAFHQRVWNNAMVVCDNYLSVARKGSILLKLRMFCGTWEVCSDSYVRQCLSLVKKTRSRKTVLFVQSYTYPLYLLLRSFC